MTDLSPFQPSVTLSREQHQVLALAAVFQAAQIVHLIALRGNQAVHDAGDRYSQTLLQAAINIRATDNPNQNSLLFFGSLEHLGLGLRTLEQSLIAPYDPQPKHRFPRFKLPASKQTLAYAMAMLQLSNKVYSNKDFQQKILNTQQQIIRQLTFFEHNFQHQSIIQSLATLYTDTASTMKPRIMVKGTARTFKNPHDVALIRATLFTGLQAAHFWRQLGGSPWKMIFTKSKTLKQIRYFASIQHQQSQKEMVHDR